MFQNPKPLRVIGIMGRAGAGKDTCCDLLRVIAREVNLKAAKVAFADPIKKMCSDIYCFAGDVPQHAFYGDQDQKEIVYESMGGRSGREVMQFIGGGAFKAITEDVWVRYLVKHAKVMAKYGTELILVSDIRHVNEAIAVRDMGGIVVRIVRDSANGSTNTGIQGHASEIDQESIDADVEINNNGTVDELKHALRSLL